MYKNVKDPIVPLHFKKKKGISKASTLKVAEIKIEVYHFSIHLKQQIYTKCLSTVQKGMEDFKENNKIQHIRCLK